MKMKQLVRAAFLILLGFEFISYERIINYGQPTYTWLGLLLTVLVVWLMLEIMEHIAIKQSGRGLPAAVWVTMFISIAIDAFGDFLHFYKRWESFDQLVHFTGAAMGMFVWFHVFQTFTRMRTHQYPVPLTMLFAGTITLSLGTLYEMEEYLEDYFLHSHRLGPGTDTANDLMMNFLGAATVFALLFLYHTYKQRSYKNTSK